MAPAHFAQAELERMTRLYTMLSRITQAIVRADDANQLFADTCRIAVEVGGFGFAWIALIDPDTLRLKPVAHAGVPVSGDWFDQRSGDGMVADGLCPAGIAIRDEQEVVVADIASDPRAELWRDVARQFCLGSVVSFPLRHQCRVIGAFTLCAGEASFFATAEMNLLREVVDDVCFALEGLRREEARIATESRVQFYAYYDAQTGLPNRLLFLQRLAEACAAAPAVPRAVMDLHIRNFHEIEQALGQGAGLALARKVAARLESALPAASVARLSEAEFAIRLDGVGDEGAIKVIATGILEDVGRAIEIAGQEVFADAVVGLAMCHGHGDADNTLKHAMAAAWQNGLVEGERCRVFHDGMAADSRQRLDLDASLRRAIDRGEFLLHFQPQLDLRSGRVIGCEALLRWNRPDQGMVSPQAFIGRLEDSGLICPVGNWVLEEACRQSRRWLDAGLTPLRMAVNVSARQFHETDVVGKVRRALEEYRLDPEMLEIELTESVVLGNVERAIRTMRELKAMGVTLAMDDFGTGYSSLGYLQRLPVQRLKIDQSFIRDLHRDPGAAAITRAIVAMARSLNLTVLAEGVETEGHVGYLRQLHCTEMQGYFFSRPVAAQDFAALVRDSDGIGPASEALADERVVLILDDEPSILSAIRRVLRREGYRLLEATSADDAFNLLAMHRVGVVVSDHRMPGMTGSEFLRRVKDLYPETVRILLTGYTEINSVMSAVNLGAIFRFLTKPWEDDALRDSIRDAFRMQEMARENREMAGRLGVLNA